MQNSLLSLAVCLILGSGLASMAMAQTFENPDAESSDGLLDEVEQSTPENNQIDEDLLEDVIAQQGDETQSASEDVFTEADIDSGEFDSFVPSEDISEDFSVPFPVDI